MASERQFLLLRWFVLVVVLGVACVLTNDFGRVTFKIGAVMVIGIAVAAARGLWGLIRSAGN
jgi:hypothetical protein